MFKAITARPRPFAAAALVGALALATPTITASAHVPCGKHKPRHTNCGKHKGQLKHGHGTTGPTGPTGSTGTTGRTGTTGTTGAGGPPNGQHGRGRGHGASSSAHAAKKSGHVPCGKTKAKHTNCGKHKGASKGKKNGHSK
jgi:hypothetical protein